MGTDPTGAGSSAAGTAAAASAAAAAFPGAGASSAAPAPYPPQGAAAAPYPPQGVAAPPYPPQGAAYPPASAGVPPPPAGGYGAAPPNFYAQQQQHAGHGPSVVGAPAVVQGRPPLVSIISPEDAKKIRKMQWLNFAFTMVQLLCSLAIILLVRNQLTSFRTVTSPSGGVMGLELECFLAGPRMPSTCEYAYSLASVSIFFCFILSLMQCLTMDCCGMGRAVEAGFDAAACAWWVAGAITLGTRASDANRQGVPNAGARNAVVALCWISAAFFAALFVTNLILIKKLGRAYKAAAQQMQQHLTAYPAAGGVQMAHLGAPGGAAPYHPHAGFGGAAPAPYPPAPGAAPAQQQWQGPPPGYPTSPPNAGAHNV